MCLFISSNQWQEGSKRFVSLDAAPIRMSYSVQIYAWLIYMRSSVGAPSWFKYRIMSHRERYRNMKKMVICPVSNDAELRLNRMKQHISTRSCCFCACVCVWDCVLMSSGCCDSQKEQQKDWLPFIYLHCTCIFHVAKKSHQTYVRQIVILQLLQNWSAVLHSWIMIPEDD